MKPRRIVVCLVIGAVVGWFGVRPGHPENGVVAGLLTALLVALFFVYHGYTEALARDLEINPHLYQRRRK